MPKYAVDKSIVIGAPLEAVYSKVRDFRQWPLWSPWLIIEPDCSLRFLDKGRGYAWEGRFVGSGAIEITREYRPYAIEYRLTFLTPWKSVSKVRHHFQAQGDGTEVAWTMEGSLPLFLFWMKPMIVGTLGLDFLRGLGMLRDLVETGSVPSKLEFTGFSSYSGGRYLGIANSCTVAKVGPSMELDFVKLDSWLGESGLESTGSPFSIYHRWDAAKDVVRYTIGFPFLEPPAAPSTFFKSGQIPACDVYTIKHTGPYRHLGNAWTAGIYRARNKVFRQKRGIHPFETYENLPGEVPEDDLVTVLHFPVVV